VLNLGPQPDGRFAPEENVRLQAIGEWLEKNGEAIYSTKGSPFQGEYHWGSLTHKKHRVYLHLFGSYGDEIKVNGIVSRVKKAWCLHNHEKVDFQQNPEEASFNLKVPLKASALPCPIIVLELAETLQVNKEKGPIDLPPVLKHLHRKSITGRITATEALGFTIENDNEKIKFKLNDKLKYRINDKGTIRQVSGFHLQEESEYKVVYTDVEEPKVNFITKIIDRK
jgi:alpha-L-fucosidase